MDVEFLMPRSRAVGEREDRHRAASAHEGRLDVTARVAAAVFGGYGVAVIGAAFLARVLPLAPAEATALAMLMSFVIYTAVIIWTFAARSAATAWFGLAAAAGGLCVGLATAGLSGG